MADVNVTVATASARLKAVAIPGPPGPVGSLGTPGANQIGGVLRATTDGAYQWLGGSADKVNLVVICGQSNAMGARNGGPNPANPLVKVWDAMASGWGSSDFTQAPWTYAAPNGNLSCNNTGLSFAHRLAVETGKPTYLVFYFVGGTSIDHWVFDGNAGGNGDFYSALKARMAAALATPELAGKTTIDALIYAQGEEDYTRDFATYSAKLKLLDTQFRAETWFTSKTPIFITGMSGLHDRYQITPAHQYHCANVNANCRYVNSKGLQTEYDASGGVSGDYTHWLGPSLWEMGYDRVWAAYSGKQVNPRSSNSILFGRASGPATIADPQVITTFTSLTSWESRDLTASGITSLVAATGSISWGYQCAADGNYSFALGYNVSTGNLCNYTGVIGRDSSATDNADYCGVFGYQNVADATYSLVAGRGNTAASSGSCISGLFAEFTTAQTDPVTFQHGVGTTTSNRKNALTARYSGAAKLGASSTVASLPSAANAAAGSQIFASNGNNGLGCQLISDGSQWRKLDELSGYFAQTATSGTVSLTPLVSSYLHNFRAVTLTGNIVVNPLTTNAYPGLRFEVWAPSSLGSFTFTVNGVSRAAGSSTVLVYNGTAFV